MTDQEKPIYGKRKLPEIGEELSRQEIMAVLSDEGYSAAGRKGWLKQVLTRLAKEQHENPNETRAELVAEITDILDENVPGDTKADDSLWRIFLAAFRFASTPIVDEALLQIAAIYKIEAEIRGVPTTQRRAVRQEKSRPLVDEFFVWLNAQADRVSRKSELGKALAYMLRRREGFRLFLDDGHVDMDSNLVENAIRSTAMTRRNTLFAGHDDGARCWARFASLIGTCRINGVEPHAYLLDLYTKLTNGHLKKDIDALMPWAYAAATSSQMSSPGTP